MRISALIAEHTKRRDEDTGEIEAALYACGWRSHSALPGSLWLWRKSFPESKTQWIWQGKGENRRKVPHPPFEVNGATLETAITIESAWQRLWVDEPSAPAPPPAE